MTESAVQLSSVPQSSNCMANSHGWFRYRCVILTLTATTCLFILLHISKTRFPNYYGSYGRDKVYLEQSSYNISHLRAARTEKKVILVWTSFFDDWNWLTSDSVISKCSALKEGFCEITTNRSLLAQATAVLFHWRDVNLLDLPKKELNQKWVLINFESPNHVSHKKSEILGSLIDWTMTYRLDSNIYAPYGRLKPRRRECKDNSTKSLPTIETLTVQKFKRKKLIGWMVSNCDAISNRQSYVKELQKFVDVDVYGSCGDSNMCPKTINRLTCYQKLAGMYKFYLSFENSLCQDYVTEKFFLPLTVGMVPIAFGGADYSRIAPKGSYINALQYESPSKLADYLVMLGQNFTLYQRYLRWTRDYYVDMEYKLTDPICDICYKLHSPESNTSHSTKKHSKHWSLSNWWFDGGACWAWKNAGVHG